MNHNCLTNRLFKLFLLNQSLLVISFSAFSANQSSCVVNPSVKNINITNVNISPNSQVGDLLSTKTEISSTVGKCSSPSGLQPFLYHIPQPFTSNGVARYNGRNVTYTYQNITCDVYNTTTSGIGIVWFNYNSGAGTWGCVNGNIRRGLPKNPALTNTIKDAIFLVRTGDIYPGTFSYNVSLPTYIVDGANGFPDAGQSVAYNVNIIAPKTPINVGMCTISYDKNPLTFSSLKTRSILKKNNKLASNVTVSLACSGGFLPPIVYIKPKATSLYLSDATLARSRDGLLGMSLYEGNSSTPISFNSTSVPVSIYNNKGSVAFSTSVYSQESDAKLIRSSPVFFDIDFSL